MINAPMQLEHYFYTNLQITALQNYNFKRGHKYNPDNFQIETAYSKSKDFPEIVQLQLHIKYNPQKKENIPYKFNINAIGFFRRISQSNSATQLFLQVHAPALLYTATREIIASITARGPFGPVFLPIKVFMPKTTTKPKKRRVSKK